MTDTLVGKKLGDYRLESRLTSGGMAHIYMGIDEKLGRKAAIKILTPDMGSHDTTLASRFQREARAIARLEHDNIIPVYQFGIEDSLYFFAMRYIEGNDLGDEMKAHRQENNLMDVERALNILAQVAAALDYAHQRGIIHRDVKPSNVLLGPDDKAILSDFGLVLWQSVDATMGTAFGTPRYISPEQATDSQSAVPQSDIYSLAVILYEILTGHPLFSGATPMEIALAHITESPVPPRALNLSIPADAQQEILRALAKDPEKRHDSAMAFIEAVRKAYDGEKHKKDRQPGTGKVAEAAASTLPFKEDEMPPDNDGAVPATSPDRSAEILSGWGKDNPTLVDAPGTQAEIVPSLPDQDAARKQSDQAGDDSKQPQMPLMMVGVVGIVIVAGLVLLMMAGGGGGTEGDNGGNSSSTTSGGGNTSSIDASAILVFDPDRIPDLPVVPPEEATINLYYTDDLFAVLNISPEPLDISTLRLVGDGGSGAETFDNTVLDTLPPGGCLLIQNRHGRNLTVPAAWNCQRNAEAAMQRLLFWRADSLSDVSFTVQRGDTVITECYTIGRAVRQLEPVACAVNW